MSVFPEIQAMKFETKLDSIKDFLCSIAITTKMQLMSKRCHVRNWRGFIFHSDKIILKFHKNFQWTVFHFDVRRFWHFYCHLRYCELGMVAVTESLILMYSPLHILLVSFDRKKVRLKPVCVWSKIFQRFIRNNFLKIYTH